MDNENRWYNTIKKHLDPDLAEELAVKVPEYSGQDAEIVPRYYLFSQETILMMQLIRELRKFKSN